MGEQFLGKVVLFFWLNRYQPPGILRENELPEDLRFRLLDWSEAPRVRPRPKYDVGKTHASSKVRLFKTDFGNFADLYATATELTKQIIGKALSIAGTDIQPLLDVWPKFFDRINSFQIRVHALAGVPEEATDRFVVSQLDLTVDAKAIASDAHRLLLEQARELLREMAAFSDAAYVGSMLEKHLDPAEVVQSLPSTVRLDISVHDVPLRCLGQTVLTELAGLSAFIDQLGSLFSELRTAVVEIMTHNIGVGAISNDLTNAEVELAGPTRFCAAIAFLAEKVELVRSGDELDELRARLSANGQRNADRPRIEKRLYHRVLLALFMSSDIVFTSFIMSIPKFVAPQRFTWPQAGRENSRNSNLAAEEKSEEGRVDDARLRQLNIATETISTLTCVSRVITGPRAFDALIEQFDELKKSASVIRPILQCVSHLLEKLGLAEIWHSSKFALNIEVILGVCGVVPSAQQSARVIRNIRYAACCSWGFDSDRMQNVLEDRVGQIVDAVARHYCLFRLPAQFKKRAACTANFSRRPMPADAQRHLVLLITQLEWLILESMSAVSNYDSLIDPLVQMVCFEKFDLDGALMLEFEKAPFWDPSSDKFKQLPWLISGFRRFLDEKNAPSDCRVAQAYQALNSVLQMPWQDPLKLVRMLALRNKGWIEWVALVRCIWRVAVESLSSSLIDVDALRTHYNLLAPS